jgi:hypothetical protein
MCRTSSPPRRDLYELEQTLTAENQESAETTPEPTGSFLLPRLTVRVWTSGRAGIYNANYASNGERFLDLRNPWTVVTPSNFRVFKTHHEALTWALQEAAK